MNSLRKAKLDKIIKEIKEARKDPEFRAFARQMYEYHIGKRATLD